MKLDLFDFLEEAVIHEMLYVQRNFQTPEALVNGERRAVLAVEVVLERQVKKLSGGTHSST